MTVTEVARSNASSLVVLAMRRRGCLGLWVDLGELSATRDGDLDDGLSKRLELVGAFEADGEEIEVLLERSEPRADRPLWRISSRTLTAMAPLFERTPWIEDHLPSALRDTRLFEMALWQWLALPALAGIAVLLARILIRVSKRPVETLTRALFGGATEFVDATHAPARLLLATAIFAALLRSLSLAVPPREILSQLTLGVAGAAIVWFVARVIDVAAVRLLAQAESDGRTGAAGLIPPATRVLKVVLGALVALALAQNLGLNVTGVIAGLGVGGLAIALAAQKTVENLFGGLTLAADQPVRVGDFCRFGDKIGTVEAIGLRSTRVRTLDRTLVTVPNSDFSSLQLENYTERDRIWLHLTLGLRYETTPLQLRHVLAGLRRLLREHPRVDPDPARVRFLNYGAYSLDLEVFAYIRTREYDEYLAIREEILLGIMDVVAASGSGFAFPSQTIYGAPDTGIDPVRARAAEAEISVARADS